MPSRNEQFAGKTVADLLAKAQGDIEIIVIAEGGWPNPPLPTDPRITILHHGDAKGMRPAINAATRIATGEYFLKCDAHTMWAEGFDLQLKQDYAEDNWILIPRRYALEPLSWTIDTSNRKYPIDAHFLSEPFEKHGDAVPGLHASAWTARRDARKHVAIDREIGSQGSAWFVSRTCWDWLGPMDASLFGSFWYENLEMSMKAWLRGGAQMRTLNTWYAHVFKGRRFGRGYSTSGMGHEAATQYSTWLYMTDQPFTGKTRSFRSLIEEFMPMPTWGDVDATFARAHRELRNPYVVAA